MNEPIAKVEPPLDFLQSWIERCEDRHQRGILVGALQGIRYQCTPELRKQIDDVLKRCGEETP